MHTIKATIVYAEVSADWHKESLRILVNLQFLNGMWRRDGAPSADMHWPRVERLWLIELSSFIFTSWLMLE